MKRQSKAKKNEIGLYTPQEERDSCGVGMLADLKSTSSRYIVDAALTALENMEHRGASGCEQNTGDGAGILTQLPHKFFEQVFFKNGDVLPKMDKYGVGMFFMPQEEQARRYCEKVILKWVKKKDFQVLHIREVPVDNSILGNSALSSEPKILQYFFKTAGFNNKDLERRFYFLRSSIMKEIYFSSKGLTDDFYITSLSSKTIVYKGLLTANQLRTYYPDLQDPLFQSAIAIVHSRFSTNTLPKWKLAQPFRCIAHNGEINTIQGNQNWWNAREKYMELISKNRPDLTSIMPVCDPFLSDSGNFDNVVDFLLRASRSIPHSIMMMIPEAWQNNPDIEDYKKAFYEYHDALIEPWDGPASICFTDGTVIGATLDRNGLRPSRYILTKDNLLILGSEAGCIDIDPSQIKLKGRLQPGKMLVADLDEHRIISDKELKETICKRKPYREWLNQNAKHIDEIPYSAELDSDHLELRTRQIACGMSLEDKEIILKSMTEKSQEPIGSMGADIPLAILSKIAQHPANYFKQQFAQVTNPPIDPLREKFYMSLSTVIGGGSGIITTGSEEAKILRFDHPILDHQKFANLIHSEIEHLQIEKLDITYPSDESLKSAVKRISKKALQIIANDKQVIILDDVDISKGRKNIPSLLITGALHHYLIKKGLRKEVALVVKAGDIWETHHVACLLSFGADLIYPYLALDTVNSLAIENKIPESIAQKSYIKAVNKGLLKIMSKLGISCISSYKGAQTFEILGLHSEVVKRCFRGTISRIEGLGFEGLERENDVKHRLVFDNNFNSLPDVGNYQWKRKGEYHLFNPQTIHLLQHSTRTNDYKTYKKFTNAIDQLEHNNSVLRSFFTIKPGTNPIPLTEVESAESIYKRFATGAMSLGSISHEAHSTLAIALNRIGGKSNSGEGGEDPRRFAKKENGDWERSAIKQVASGRFGVDIHYLNNAVELQIKMAQGAKPGEGGQLPGHKVNDYIGSIRNATPGVSLISPPPHHDIYSIEDLKQLIFDLKNANPSARISVKLVSKAGVGVIASGVVKAFADHILISGSDGGTGASPLSSIRHAGLPWELGLSETHQTLVKNGLRDRVVLQADGQIRTGRDLAIATILGAEEWGVATAALVVEGCILMRKCHLNTCPVGIATQDKELRKKFNGKVEHVVNYFQFLAAHLREIMAELGVRTVNELVGRTDLLEIDKVERHWKTEGLDLSPILYREKNVYNNTMYQSVKQDAGLDNVLDHKLIRKSRMAIRGKKSYSSIFPISNTDLAVGTMLSNEIVKMYGADGMAEDSLEFWFKGSAGQSFCAFGIKGIHFHLEGEANDYFGKGLSGAKLVVKPDQNCDFIPEENIIIGNVALYGATSGKVFINGKAGDRFAVRNSGAEVVVEGIGDNGCEYMTGGIVIILGDIGQNFAAGMSGGVAYLYTPKKKLPKNFNSEMVLVENEIDHEDKKQVRKLVRMHTNYTGSPQGFRLLNNWEEQQNNFIKIIPTEYKNALQKLRKKERVKNNSNTSRPSAKVLIK